MCDIKEIYPKRRCDNQDISVIIMWKGKEVNLCEGCWKKVSKSDLEW